MQETYTFSRALHLMRYSGKKMRPITDTDDYCIIVKNNQLVGRYDGMETVVIDEDNMPSWFTPKDIMGSWVEVK
jgi:hypothetical protein